MFLADLLKTYGPTVDCDLLHERHRKDNVVLGKLRPDAAEDDGEALTVEGVTISNVGERVAVMAGAEHWPRTDRPELAWRWRSMLFVGLTVAGVRYAGRGHTDAFWASGTVRAKDAIDLTLIDCRFLCGTQGAQVVRLEGHWRRVTLIGVTAAGMKHSLMFDLRNGSLAELYARRSPLAVTCKAGMPAKVDGDGMTVVRGEA